MKLEVFGGDARLGFLERRPVPADLKGRRDATMGYTLCKA